jgi:glycerate dehydrogenase
MRPHITILDGHTLNPGDLTWESLESLGQLTVHPRTAVSEIVSRAAEADILLTNKVPLSAETLELLPGVKAIGVLATGYNIVDTSAAKARGIPVMNVPGYSTPSVAQHVFSLLLQLTNATAQHSESVHAGEWSACPDFCYWKQPLLELAGLKMGIIGWGAIGQAVGKIAQAFGMEVLVATRSARPPEPGVRFVGMDEVFAAANVVSLHCPLTPETQNLVNTARLATMRSDAYLINTGRGPLVNEADLAAALRAGKIAGAGLDVLCNEPARSDNPLLGAPRCIITPHVAWASKAARQRLLGITVANLKAFLEGKPQNVVNS